MNYKDFYFGMQSVSLPLHFYNFLSGSKIQVVAVLIYTHGLSVSHISVKKMEDYLTIKQSQIYATLEALKREGVIERVGRGWKVNARWKFKEYIEEKAAVKGFSVSQMIDDQIAELEKWKKEVIKAEKKELSQAPDTAQPSSRGGYTVRRNVSKERSYSNKSSKVCQDQNQKNQKNLENLVLGESEIDSFLEWYASKSTRVQSPIAFKNSLKKKLKNGTFENANSLIAEWRTDQEAAERSYAAEIHETVRLTIEEKIRPINICFNKKDYILLRVATMQNHFWLQYDQGLDIDLSFSQGEELLKINFKEQIEKFLLSKIQQKEFAMNTS
ncbi:hypothetical protein AGMMS50229_08760 [Campylobacterota bacterium]|nr:hypothetical protein AGMMS50229_08760 [Campylobacterota bacterium]